jgi:hypothetical protein
MQLWVKILNKKIVKKLKKFNKNYLLTAAKHG